MEQRAACFTARQPHNANASGNGDKSLLNSEFTVRRINAVDDTVMEL